VFSRKPVLGGAFDVERARRARARTRRLDANTDAIERARASSSSFAR
jgi:hypothetical protein